jgi:phosphoglycerate dehydrogenase-like enzyme
MPNVMVTPHVAFYSAAAIEELARRAAEQVAQVLRGEIPTHLVNPAVLDHPWRRFHFGRNRYSPHKNAKS